MARLCKYEKHEKPINISVKIFAWVCIIGGVAAMFTPLYLPAQLNNDIAEVRWFALICLIVFGVGSLLFVKYKKYIGVFIFYVLFMTVMSAFATEEFFEVDYKFGQQDLVQFAKYAKIMIIKYLHLIWIENIHSFITMMN